MWAPFDGHASGLELEIRLLRLHRQRLVDARTRLSDELSWELHDLGPGWSTSQARLRSITTQRQIARRLNRAEPTVRVRIARDMIRRICDLTRTINELHQELTERVAQVAPQLLAENGLWVITAAELIGEIAGVDRFTSDAQLARLAGFAPVPVSSWRTDRSRSDRGGNRQRHPRDPRARCSQQNPPRPTDGALHGQAAAARQDERKPIRCLKRHLVRRIYNLLRTQNEIPITLSLAT